MKIFLCGDVMLGRAIDQIQIQSAPPQIYEDYFKDARSYVKLAEGVSGTIPRSVSADYVWGETMKIFRARKPDIKIINLETAMTINESYFPKGINYRMHPANVSILEAAGIDICALANNHVLDWGIQGMKDTMATLESADILYAGAGRTLSDAQAPATVETKEGRLLLFSVAHTMSGVPEEWAATEMKGGIFFIQKLNKKSVDGIAKVINHYKNNGDVIVLSIHWGTNWGHEIPEDHRSFAHALIDQAGVHIVYGHSSHHPRAIEVYRGCPIFYGCGDFINDYEGIQSHQEFRGNLVLAYFVDVRPHPFKLKRIDIDCLKLKHFQLVRPPLKDVQWMYVTLNEVSEGFQLPLQLTEKRIFCEF